MHNLYFVTFGERCRGPIGAADYPAVDFYSYAFRLQVKRAYKVN